MTTQEIEDRLVRLESRRELIVTAGVFSVPVVVVLVIFSALVLVIT